MKIIAGQVVRGSDFWDRKYLLEDILEIIENNGHILLVAPRRVGKTSLMYRIKDTMDQEYLVIYINTEAEHSLDDFWKKLFYTLTDDEFLGNIQQKAKIFFENLKSIRFDELTLKGVKFGDSKDVEYDKVFKELLKSYDGDKKLIIMLDEFSQTVENIIKHESSQQAEKLLQSHREIRQDEQLSQKTVFIYAGSIGLESVVATIQASKYINDLDSISVPPLEFDDAKEFTKKLLEQNDITTTDEDIEYILEKVKWYIPFYIQLICKEIKRLYRRNPLLDKAMIDKAEEKVLQQRKDFIHWEERLNILSKDERKFAKDVLNGISIANTITSNEIVNLGEKYQLDEEMAKKIIHSLKYDGYIDNTPNPKEYRFNSPLLQTWWCNNVAN